MENYAKKLMAAESFLQKGNLEWPLEGKVFSGVLCSQCGYAFDQNDQAFTFCPHCHEPLVLSKEIAPVNSMNSKPVTQTESSSAWIIVAAQAPKQFGH